MKRLSNRKLRLGLMLKIFKNNGSISSTKKQKKQTFLHLIEAIPASEVKNYYLRVTYGKFLDVFGKMETFFNDGEYETKKDLLYALTIFTEKGLLDYFEN